MFVVSFVACFVDIVHQPKGPFVVSIVVIFVDVTSEICKRPVNCPMDRGMREDPGSVRVQEAASGSPVRVGFQFAGASSAISVMFMSGNLLRTSVR